MNNVRQTKNDLKTAVREKIIPVLQSTLNKSLELRGQSLQAHWNVRGPNFKMLHELFEELVTGLDENVDLLAERIAQLGGYPIGTAAEIAGSLPKYPEQIARGEEHLAALLDRIAILGEEVRKGIEITADDADTADIMTGFSRYLDKQLWFFESHLG